MKKLLILILTITAFVATPSFAKDKGTMEIKDAWSRETKKGMRAGGAFFKIINKTLKDDAITKISSPVAMITEMHETREDANGSFGMYKQEEIKLPVGKQVELKPGSLHVMFMGLKKPLKAGTELPLTIEFKNSPTRTVRVDILDRKMERLKMGKAAVSGMDHSKMGHN